MNFSTNLTNIFNQFDSDFKDQIHPNGDIFNIMSDLKQVDQSHHLRVDDERASKPLNGLFDLPNLKVRSKKELIKSVIESIKTYTGGKKNNHILFAATSIIAQVCPHFNDGKGIFGNVSSSISLILNHVLILCFVLVFN
jgi:hypothetical protein